MEEHLSSEQLLKRYQQNHRTIENVWISGPGLEQADLHGITLRDVRLHEVDLSGANLSGAFLERVIIEFAQLRHTNLTYAILRDVTIRQSELPEVTLQGANVQQVVFEPHAYDRLVELPHANLSYATLVGVNLRRANLFGANLTAANLSDVDISGANLRQVLTGRTNLEHVTQDADTLWEPILAPDPQAARTRSRKRGGQHNTLAIASAQGGTDYISIPGTNKGIPLEQAKKLVLLMLQGRSGRGSRAGQAKFRARLFETYQGRCAITGCRLEPTLEAAHIYPYCLHENNDPTNGILLRNDLHALFDWNLLTIDPLTKQISLDPSVEEEDYRRLHGRVIATPFTDEFVYQTWTSMLQWRWDEYACLVEGLNPTTYVRSLK
jgi:uncharacterized protein YjbI with pentapeptide repeats